MYCRLATLYFVLVTLLACGGSGPVPVSPDPAGEPEAVLTLDPYVANLLTVEVMIGDSTVDFLFDTGGGGTLYTVEAAAEAGCAPFGRVTGFRHNGDPVHAQRCPPASLVVDGWAAPRREPGVFDLWSLLPRSLPPLGGIVAMDLFEGRPVTLDLGDLRVVVETPASLSARVEGRREVPLREGRQSGGAMLDPFLAIDSPDGPLWFELDSGNTGPVLIAPHAARQLGLDLSTEEPRTVTLHLTGYGPVEVQAQAKEMIYDGLLNAEILRRHEVTLDLGAGRAWIAPN